MSTVTFTSVPASARKVGEGGVILLFFPSIEVQLQLSGLLLAQDVYRAEMLIEDSTG